jgi:hypothetical protein
MLMGFDVNYSRFLNSTFNAWVCRITHRFPHSIYAAFIHFHFLIPLCDFTCIRNQRDHEPPQHDMT